MKILIVHERYRQAGGEDTVFTAEQELLSRAGHEIVTYTDDNRRIDTITRPSLAFGTIWSRRATAELRRLVRRERPQIAHFHNTFPLLSPAVYRAAREEGTAVVHTLHNYRLLCLNATFLRQGRVCQDCLGVLPWRGVVHRCYRSSLAASTAVAAMIGAHRAFRTWSKQVDAFITPTDFARTKFEEGGLPSEKLHVKQNFLLEDPGVGTGKGGYFLFVGRLSEEKGLKTLLRCWQDLGPGAPPIRIVGDGPLTEQVMRAAESLEPLTYLGPQSPRRVRELMKSATSLLLPSLWFEGLPMVAIEALATGLPIVASRIGGLPEIVVHGWNGWLVPSGDPVAWGEAISTTMRDRAALKKVRRNARAEYEKRYSATPNLRRLLEIYSQALATRGAHEAHDSPPS